MLLIVIDVKAQQMSFNKLNYICRFLVEEMYLTTPNYPYQIQYMTACLMPVSGVLVNVNHMFLYVCAQKGM